MLNDVSSRPAVSLRPPVTGADGRTGVKPRILLVEDEDALQDLFQEALASEYHLKRAKTAAEAFEALSHETPAAVILDYRLPDGNGLEVLRRIREQRPELPVIMITGYGSESVCQTALRLGATDYFVKPMSIFEFIEAVHRVTDPSRARSAPSSSLSASAKSSPRENEVRVDIAVQRALLVIQQRYWDNLTLSQIAKQVGTSKYALSRRFSRLVGVPFRTYLLETRLERARHLLANTVTSMTEITHLVGFGDLPQFDKQFRRHVGVAPSRYRTLLRREKVGL